ncbi:MAG TPA: hypothetical protein VGI03_04035 [Verrucomicrobiae bacterium]
MLATSEIIRETAQPLRLRKLLSEWRQVPMYRNYPFHGLGAGAETDRLVGFERLPFTGKQEIRRDFPENFLRPGQNLDQLLEQDVVEVEHTSGTSDDQLSVLFKRGWWDTQEERALRLNPFVSRILEEQPDARRATLTTPACNGRVCFSAWLSRVNRTMGKTLFVNQARIPFLMTDEEMARMAAEIADWSPQFLEVDPVHGAWFALFCERQGLRFPSLRFVLCSYEFLSVVHRRILQRAFGIPVFNLYGSTETGHLLMEDERGEMKPSYENAFLEIIEPDGQGRGELVATTLTNDYMPLIRYRIGDLAERQERPYGTSYIVHGRLRDLLGDKTGRRVTTWDVDQCFSGISGIAHYQLRQAKDNVFSLRYVPESSGPPAKELNDLVSRLETLLQPADRIDVESVSLLPPTPSGKFRLTYNAAAS